jgi:hypothetical protein
MKLRSPQLRYSFGHKRLYPTWGVVSDMIFFITWPVSRFCCERVPVSSGFVADTGFPTFGLQIQLRELVNSGFVNDLTVPTLVSHVRREQNVRVLANVTAFSIPLVHGFCCE